MAFVIGARKYPGATERDEHPAVELSEGYALEGVVADHVPHTVLSRSSITHFAHMPEAASTVSSSDWGGSGRCSRRQGVFAMSHIRASNHCVRPTEAARKSTSLKNGASPAKAMRVSWRHALRSQIKRFIHYWCDGVVTDGVGAYLCGLTIHPSSAGGF
jgi:hypothetical protein